MAVGGSNGPEDEILIFGPFRGSAVMIYNYFNAFKLLRLIERVKHWARKTYWPWYCSNITEPLKARSTNVDYNDSNTDLDEDIAASGQKF